MCFRNVKVESNLSSSMLVSAIIISSKFFCFFLDDIYAVAHFLLPECLFFIVLYDDKGCLNLCDFSFEKQKKTFLFSGKKW